MFDFDAIDQWGPSLSSDLAEIVPDTAYAFLRDRRPKTFEEYRDTLFEAPGVRPSAIIAATANWLRSQSVIAYHGSRLSANELQRIQAEGLRPLDARSRAARLSSIFAGHPGWSDIASGLSAVIDEFGIHGVAKGHGRREGFVHATISRACLLRRFDRYLVYGSEFDQMVAQTLIGEGGLRCLANYGAAVVMKLCIPGPLAIEAANAYPWANEKMPRPIDDILYSWARWSVDRAFSSAEACVDCGLRFAAPIPADWIVGHETLDNATLALR
jgi:hypothetical protein